MSLIKQLLFLVALIALATLGLLLSQGPAAPAPTPAVSPAEQTAGSPVALPAGSQSPIAGLWLGTLNAGGAQLRLVLEVTVSAEGALAATLDSVDQNAFDLPIDEITLVDGVLIFVMSELSASYEGRLSADGSKIEGTWKQGGGELSLAFEPIEEQPGQVRRPQDPVEPFPYKAEEVRFANEAAGIELAGTLTLPPGAGPFAAAVLVTGSGPQNRNEELLNHRPFLVLADHLTRNGIAVLRYDERGVGQSGGVFSEATSEVFAADAGAAVRYLKGRSEINPAKIGVIGHSEGGLVAPLVAAGDPDVAFIVLLAGPGLPGDQIILLQSALIARADGASEELLQKNLAVTKAMFEVVKNEPDNELAGAEARRLLKEFAAGLTDEEKQELGYSEEAIDLQVAQLLSPWFRFFLQYDPVPTLTKVTCPVLVLNGERDLQVPARENLLAIANALEAGGNRDYAIVKLAALNHLFQTSTTGSPSEYAQIDETFAPVALKTITDWIVGHTAPGPE